MEIYFVYTGITIYIVWLFWDNRNMLKKDRKDSLQYKKVKSRIHTEYKNIGVTILNCDSPELLTACYQKILIFKSEYKGRYAEELTEELFNLLEYRDLELSVIN